MASRISGLSSTRLHPEICRRLGASASALRYAGSRTVSIPRPNAAGLVAAQNAASSS